MRDEATDHQPLVSNSKHILLDHRWVHKPMQWNSRETVMTGDKAHGRDRDIVTVRMVNSVLLGQGKYVGIARHSIDAYHWGLTLANYMAIGCCISKGVDAITRSDAHEYSASATPTARLG